MAKTNKKNIHYDIGFLIGRLEILKNIYELKNSDKNTIHKLISEMQTILTNEKVIGVMTKNGK